MDPAEPWNLSRNLCLFQMADSLRFGSSKSAFALYVSAADTAGIPVGLTKICADIEERYIQTPATLLFGSFEFPQLEVNPAHQSLRAERQEFRELCLQFAAYELARGERHRAETLREAIDLRPAELLSSRHREIFEDCGWLRAIDSD